MRESVIRELQIKLTGTMSVENIATITRELCIVLDNYDVKKRCTEVAVPSEVIPDEVKMYLVGLSIEGRSKNTTSNYLITLKDFFTQVNKNICDICANDVRVYLYRYEQRANVSKATVEQRRIILRGFFEWCANEGIISSNPVRSIKAIKYETHERQPLTQLELEQVRKVCNDHREKAIIEFLYSTGCRVSELCDVKLSDINAQTGTVTLFGKGSKHRRSYLNARAQVAIQDYLSTRIGESEYLFCSIRRPYGCLHKAGVEKIVSEIEGRIPSMDKHITPHVFRHTTATQAMNSGMPIQEISTLLGHVQLSTTMIYAKTAQEQVKADHQKYVI